MAHLAWLNSTPEKASKTRRESLEERDSPLLDLPDIIYGDWLISAVFEMGPIRHTGMGAMEPISQVDIAAYAFNHGIQWKPWEANALRSISLSYAQMGNKGSDRNCPPPYAAIEATPDQRQKVDSVFRQLASRKKPRKPIKGRS